MKTKAKLIQTIEHRVKMVQYNEIAQNHATIMKTLMNFMEYESGRITTTSWKHREKWTKVGKWCERPYKKSYL